MAEPDVVGTYTRADADADGLIEVPETAACYVVDGNRITVYDRAPEDGRKVSASFRRRNNGDFRFTKHIRID